MILVLSVLSNPEVPAQAIEIGEEPILSRLEERDRLEDVERRQVHEH